MIEVGAAVTLEPLLSSPGYGNAQFMFDKILSADGQGERLEHAQYYRRQPEFPS